MLLHSCTVCSANEISTFDHDAQISFEGRPSIIDILRSLRRLGLESWAQELREGLAARVRPDELQEIWTTRAAVLRCGDEARVASAMLHTALVVGLLPRAKQLDQASVG